MKVVDMIAGQEIVINESNKVLFRQMCLVVELLKIRIDLPVFVDQSFLVDDPIEVTIDDDPSDLVDVAATDADATAEADENKDEEESASAAGFQSSSFDCVFCKRVFTNTAALDSHIKVHFVPAPQQVSTAQTPGEPLAASEPQAAVAVKQEVETSTATADTLKCDSCDKVFTLKFILEQHRKKHLTATSQPESEQRTRVNTELVLDTSTPPPEAISKTEDHYYCDHCNESFSELSLFEGHVETHSSRAEERNSASLNNNQSPKSQAKYQCHVCKLTKTNYQSLALHIGRQHLGTELNKFYDQSNPLNCKFCSQTLPNSAGLDAHLISTHNFLEKFYPSREELRIGGDAEAGETEASAEQSNDVPSEEESSRLSRQLKCPFCSAEAGNSVNLLKHVAREHYKAELQAMYAPGTDWQCKECKSTFDDEESLINHLMSVHKALNKLLVLVGRQRALNEAQKKARTESAHSAEPGKAQSSEVPDSGTMYKCSKCKMSSGSYYTLLMHLAYSHYKKEILNLMGESQTECKFCRKVFTRRQGVFSHVAATHAIDEGILPAKSQFEQSSSNGSSSENPDGANEAANAKRTPSARLYKCPSCKNEHGSYKKLLGHVARSHFKMELLQMYSRSSNKNNSCDSCSNLFVSDEDDLVKHLAQDHGQLAEFLPSKEAFIASDDQEFKSCHDCGKFFDHDNVLDEHRMECAAAKKSTSTSTSDRQVIFHSLEYWPSYQLGPVL